MQEKKTPQKKQLMVEQKRYARETPVTGALHSGMEGHRTNLRRIDDNIPISTRVENQQAEIIETTRRFFETLTGDIRQFLKKYSVKQIDISEKLRLSLIELDKKVAVALTCIEQDSEKSLALKNATITCLQLLDKTSKEKPEIFEKLGVKSDIVDGYLKLLLRM